METSSSYTVHYAKVESCGGSCSLNDAWNNLWYIDPDGGTTSFNIYMRLNGNSNTRRYISTDDFYGRGVILLGYNNKNRASFDIFDA